MNPLNHRKFPRIDLEVSEISYGALQIGNLFRPLSNQTADALLENAWNANVRYYDTAPFYGHGLSEHRLGHFLSEKSRAEYVISTKVGRTLTPTKDSLPSGQFVNMPPMKAEFDYSYDGAWRQIHESLQRMILDSVDILFLHDADHYTHGKTQPLRSQEALTGAVPALIKMREEGIVKAVGAGLNNVEDIFALVKQTDLDCLLVPGRYTLMEQEDVKELFDICEKRGIALIMGSVFNSGILATGPKSNARYHYRDADASELQKVERLTAVCQEFDVSLPAAAIQFVGAHPSVVSVCIGASSIEQQISNYNHAAEVIPTEFWAALRKKELIAEWAPTPTT